MPQKKFIKNIRNIAKAKLKEFGLSPKLSIEWFFDKDKRYYSTPSKAKDNKIIFFKILISNTKANAGFIKKEIAVTNFLEKFSKNNSKLNVPLFIKYNNSKYPYWFQREFLPGRIIGHHFKIYKLGLEKNIQEKTADNLLALQDITFLKYKKVMKEAGLKQKIYSDNLSTIKEFENILKLKNKTAITDISSVYNFLKSNKQCFNESNLILSHGDATLANFFVSRSIVYLTDWELAEINNIASDIARIWIQTYRYPKWRKTLIKYFTKNLPKAKQVNFKKCFRTMVLIQAFSELANSTLGKQDRTKIKLQETLKNTIISAQKSFNSLIN